MAGTLVVLAAIYDGSPIRKIDLNDGSVWVTNSSRGLLGRLNSQVKELDLSLITSSTSDSVFQQGSSVQVFDDGGSQDSPARVMTLVDAISGTTLPVPLGRGFESTAGGGVVAVTEPATGRVWISRTDQLEGFDPSEPATTKVSQRSQATVTVNGTVLVADRQQGTVTPWRLNEVGEPVAGDESRFGTTLLDDAALSAIGETPVILQGGKLYRDGSDAIQVDGSEAVLQQVGPDSPYVYLSTTTGLWRAELNGGGLEKISEVDVEGQPAAPVIAAGCVHAAWNDPGHDNYMRSCDGTVTSGEISGLTDASNLVFRANRDVVVLNDTFDGTAWLVQEPGLTRVDDWDSVDPNAADPQIAEADDESHSSSRNKPPTAVKDAFGARAGATVILPVTLNDIDPDGDVLVITGPPGAQGDTTFNVVGDGTQVQANVGPNVSGDIKFKYSISDGQPGNPPSETTVTLTVYPESTDKAPALIKGQKNELAVAVGHQASINVLPAWMDPEGDALVLTGATSDAGSVGFRSDGTIDFRDDGDGPSQEVVQFTVRGGGATQKGYLDVAVVDESKAAPATVADHFAGTVGSAILLDPLTNDVDPLGGQLALSAVTNVSDKGAQLIRDGSRGTATFTAPQPGAYYLTYVATASNGVPADEQTIRVDVMPASGSNRSPVATRDVAAVKAGGSSLVDVLANDTDPDGDILVVQGIVVPPQYAGLLKAALINKRFARIELTGPLDDGEEPTIQYLLSDGQSDQVTGAISITMANADKNRPPVAVEDLVVARAGTIIDIPVLENDKDPDGDRMMVGQEDLYDIGNSFTISGHRVPIVATGNSIRVLVPNDGTTQLQFGYGVTDPDRARGDSRVVVNINPDDPQQNQKPQPRPIEDRTVVGQRIRVKVNAFGSDPDGDPVVFSGVVEPPKLGRITASGSDWFDYEPIEDERRTGTDSFQVQVSDQYGLTGVADVRIGVAPPASENQAPAALNDDLVVKPGLTVQYPVMANDSDPDGDPLLLDQDDIVTQQGTTARLVDNAIEVKSPDLGAKREVVQAIQYGVSDGLGATSTALLTVTVRDDAPDYAPTTQDDVVTVAQLRGKQTGDTVDVDVLQNDGDLDGARDALTIKPIDPQAATVVGRKLRITLQPKNQLIPYLVTDQTHQSSFGFVFVNGTDRMPPMLDAEAVPLEIVAGKPLSINLPDVVVVRPGHTPKIGNENLITASNGDAVVKNKTRLEFRTPADFYGTASVTLPVIDGQDLQDPDGLESQITIPITVLPAKNVPPTVRDAAVTVAAGGKPVEILLDRLASDPNPNDKLTYETGAASGGVATRISSGILTIAANANAPSGEVDVVVSVSDGAASKVEGHVRVTVLGQGKSGNAEPPMTLRDLAVPDASADEPLTVDVRDAIVFDPFPDNPKSIVSVSVTGPAPEPIPEGTTLRVIPSSNGEIVITYVLDDGSGDPKRSVEGRIVVTVAAVPDSPSAPRAIEGGPDSVQLTWTAPADNGSDITNYIVEGDGVDKDCGRQTQCVVDQLDPGSEYRFTVTAVNGEGPSKPSPKSEPVTPDTVPDAMSAPTIAKDYADRDQKLQLAWKEPDNSGSDITSYQIESSPRVTIKDPRPGQTSVVVSGLENGKGYRFRIRAVNDRGEGVWSPYSEEQVPFTKPNNMPEPTLNARNGDGDQRGYVTVDWEPLSAPANGEDEILHYTVRLFRDGTPITSVNLADTIKSFDVENGHSYSAQVSATNRAGTSDFSATSNEEVSWDRAQAVTSITAVSDCPDGKCNDSTSSYVGRVSFTTPNDDGGYAVTSYKWRTEDGETGVIEGMPAGHGVTAAFNLSFNTPTADQSVELTPVTTVPGQGPVDGTAASGGHFNPYARPIPPTKTCGEAQYRSVHICWTAGEGNGRAVDQTSYQGDATGDGRTDITIATSQGGETKCVRARTRNAEGLWSDWTGDMCATSQARTIDVTVYGVSGNPPGPCTSNCDAILVTIGGYESNHTYDYTTNIYPSTGGPPVSGKVTTGGDGRGSKVVGYYDRTVYDERYCVKVDGPEDCENGR